MFTLMQFPSKESYGMNVLESIFFKLVKMESSKNLFMGPGILFHRERDRTSEGIVKLLRSNQPHYMSEQRSHLTFKEK